MRCLISRAQAGDDAARRELVAALGPRLESLARHYARCCHEDYDDLLGEAWFALFDALPITDVTIGQPEQYLLKRARWRVLDYIKWARRRRCPDPPPQEDPRGCVVDVAPRVVTQELVSQVSEGLSETQQAVFAGLLRGDTWREVAARLGCSSANVAYHVRQIRRRCLEVVDDPVMVGCA